MIKLCFIDAIEDEFPQVGAKLLKTLRSRYNPVAKRCKIRGTNHSAARVGFGAITGHVLPKGFQAVRLCGPTCLYCQPEHWAAISGMTMRSYLNTLAEQLSDPDQPKLLYKAEVLTNLHWLQEAYAGRGSDSLYDLLECLMV